MPDQSGSTRTSNDPQGHAMGPDVGRPVGRNEDCTLTVLVD
jgi:hypothetical protein